MLFPEEHPYSWPTIGWMPDLERISLDDVRGFFAGHYTPANGTLVLAGDIGHDEALRLAERYFGDVPGMAAPASPAILSRNGAGGAVARDTLPDRVSFARLYRAHPTAPYGSADWLALDVLAYLLGDGESSRLQRALVREEELVQEVDTYLLPTEIEGVFGIVATARGGVEPEAIESRVQRELERVAAGEVGPDELDGALRRIRRDQLAGLATLENRADALAYAATVLGEAEALNRVMEGYLAVGVDDVARVAERYLAHGFRRLARGGAQRGGGVG
jgi:zinc protease